MTAQERADAVNEAVNDWWSNWTAEDADCGYTVEARSVCDTLRAERDEAIQQRDSARAWSVAYEQRLDEIRQECEFPASSYRFAHRIHALAVAPLGAPEQVQG